MTKTKSMMGNGVVAYLLLISAVLAIALAANRVRSWQQELPSQMEVKSVVLSTKAYESVRISVPPINHAYTVEVYSAIDPLPSAAGTVISTPRVVYKQGYSELSEVIVPPIMEPGTYTVVLHAAYQLNPVKRVEQSALIAVLLVSN